MFVLEESQLLEDTIKDGEVLSLYKKLKDNEFSNRQEVYLDILSHDKLLQVSTFILTFFTDEQIRLTPEQRDEVLKRLNLTKDDAASLLLIAAATFTQLFVIENFTGPTTNNDIHVKLPEIYIQFHNQYNPRSLTLDGCEIYHLTIDSWLLKAAQLSWTFLATMGCSRRLLELEFLVWKHRYLTIYLSFSHEPPENILNELRKTQEYIFDHHIINDLKENKTQLVRFNIVELCCELVQSAILRDGITSSRKIFDYAAETSGLSIEHTGVLGKRTKFQQKDIPQLLIRVAKKDNAEIGSTFHKSSQLPKDVALDDDTLLPDISFVNLDDNVGSTHTEQDLSAEAQLLMLTKLDFLLKTEVMEESLKDEWTLAYVRSIIKSATIWNVKYKALAMRSTVERKHTRKMDRALLQMEELIKTCDKPDVEEHTRLQSFYSALPLPKWKLQRSLGDMSFDLCLYKNALEIYSRIEYWEGMIRCHNALNETVKAEKIIRQELEKQETPYLYCLLGDATDNTEHYEKSWSLSNGRFARAKKSMGTYYYVRKDYDKAIDNYEKALKASPSNVSILSLLAYCCLTLERYEKAAECYRSLTYHDDTNFLAWNNLSKAYIKMNQKERAWRTLREAIKCNFEEWKIWENFMLVSIEIGALDDVIEAWHRLIDIKTTHKDDQILRALTYSLIKQSFSASLSEFKRLLDDALRLVSRLTASGSCSSRTWICYFRLMVREFELFQSEESNKLEMDSRVSKIKNALQRSTPTNVLIDGSWSQSIDKVYQVLDAYDELLDCYNLAFDTLGPRPEILSQWKSFQLSMTNVLKTLKQKGYCETQE